MKFSYTLLKKFLGKAPKKETAVEALNLRAFEAENAEGDAIEVSLPPNRYSDAASHIGLAREIGAVLGIKAKNPVKTLVNFPQDKGFLEIKIENSKLCRRYAARYFEVQKIGDSPAWMQNALRACGMKPINNIVDLMNYVMLETGQPLHAFDFDALAKVGKRKRGVSPRRIIVRNARKGERLHALDGERYALDAKTLVIADAERPLAIAGIKGGADSGVNAKTRRIIVEAANFSPASVYETSRKLKLVTDAAARFSHGISPALVEYGLDRVTEFLTKDKAWLLDSVDIYPKPASDDIIEFAAAAYEALIGEKMDERSVKNCFGSLGFEVLPGRAKNPSARGAQTGKAQTNGAMLVRVPAWRTDITSFEDLAEEAARLRGYGKLKSKAPQVHMGMPREEDAFIFRDRARAFFAKSGLDEVYNSSFLGMKDLYSEDPHPLFDRDAKPIAVMNPIAEDKALLRPSLLPLLFKNAVSNARFFDSVRIFEIGKIFANSAGKGKEKLSLGFALAEKKNKKLILEAKGLVEDFLSGMGIADAVFENDDGALRVRSDGRIVASLDSFALEKGWFLAAAEIDAERLLLMAEGEREYKPLPKYPAVIRDLSLLVENIVRIGDVIRDIQTADWNIIGDVDLIDEYSDPKLGTKQSITVRVIFQSEERTLTDAEVNAEMEKIAELVRKKYGASVR